MGTSEERTELDELDADFERTPYRIVRPLAQGGMGSVFEALHVPLQQPIVIKLILPALAKRPQVVERLVLEGRVLANVEHENLVKVTDLNVTPGGRAFIAMELLQGTTLRALLAERGVLPPLEAIDLMVQALHGLEAAHRAHVVHRDVKLDNLFVCELKPVAAPGPGEASERRVLKVLDFGIAKALSGTLRGEPKHPTAEGTILGTPMFMSPEQAQALPVDPRSDIYSVGVVLFRAVAGRQPFTPETTLDREQAFIDLLRQHVEVAPPVPSSVAPQPLPAELDAAILKALAKRPEDRFASAEAFADALEEIARLVRARAAAARHGGGRAVPTSTELMPRPSVPLPGWQPKAGVVPAAGPSAPSTTEGTGDVTTSDALTLPVNRPAQEPQRPPLPAKRRSPSPMIYVAIVLVSAVAFTLAIEQLVAWFSAR